MQYSYLPIKTIALQAQTILSIIFLKKITYGGGWHCNMIGPAGSDVTLLHCRSTKTSHSLRARASVGAVELTEQVDAALLGGSLNLDGNVEKF